MKKASFILLLAAVTFTLAFAGDVIKVLSVYTNGIRTTIPMAGIDSLDHSLLDADSIQHSEYTSSIIHAIDQDYQIPISSIDSIVIDEIDIEQYNSQINEIQNFIDEQTDLEVDAFQTNLLNWLNANENIQEATINEEKDFITIKFKNGLDFSICFQDMSFFDDIEESSEVKALSKKANDDDINIYYIPSEENEIIIEKPGIMYIQGLDMYLDMFGIDINTTEWSNEYSEINNNLMESPLKHKIQSWEKDLRFIAEDFSHYGLVIISQTHGGKSTIKENEKQVSITGLFLVEDKRQVEDLSGINDQLIGHLRSLGMLIYKDNRFILKGSKHVYYVTPQMMAKKLENNNNSIVLGSYCYSFQMAYHVKKPVVFGYMFKSSPFVTPKALKLFTRLLFNGYTYKKSINTAIEYLNDKFLTQWHYSQPTSSNKDSKLRYFSITTDTITKSDDKGYPIITGLIKGYSNLKPQEEGITYTLYVHKGNKAFTPSSSGVTTVTDSIKVYPDGKVECKYTGQLVTDNIYSFILGFEYKNNIYYGEQKQFYVEDIFCPDENHPHAIDLGLDDGTMWSCCNVGANSPEKIGSYFAWGETEEKAAFTTENYKYRYYDEHGNYQYTDIGSDISGTEYDVAYLEFGNPHTWRMPTEDEVSCFGLYCRFGETQLNGVKGYRVTGPNGNKVFLPRTGHIFPHYPGNYPYVDDSGQCYFWSSSPSKCFKTATRPMYRLKTESRFHGLTIRPVLK